MPEHTFTPPNLADSTSVRGLGSAKEGVHHWMGQRISAIGLLPTGVLLLLWLLAHANNSYPEVVASLSSPWVSTLMFLFVTFVCYHANLGLQIIIEDYVHQSFWRYWLLIKIKLIAILLPTITLFLLIKIMLKI